MDDILFALGRRICELRKERHMSQLELALEAGVAKTYLCDLEKGRRNPTVKVIMRICEALRVTLEELFRGIV